MVNVPQQFQGNEYLEEAYRSGYNHGCGLASHNKPELWQEYWTETEGEIITTPENIREVHEILTLEAARHSRCNSPFEFTAKELNDFGDGGWFILPYGEEAIGPFDSEAEAEQEAESLGLEDYEISELPSATEAWEAFEAGEFDAICDDLSRYDDSDYGIKADSENDSEDNSET